MPLMIERQAQKGSSLCKAEGKQRSLTRRGSKVKVRKPLLFFSIYMFDKEIPHFTFASHGELRFSAGKYHIPTAAIARRKCY